MRRLDSPGTQASEYTTQRGLGAMKVEAADEPSLWELLEEWANAPDRSDSRAVMANVIPIGCMIKA